MRGAHRLTPLFFVLTIPCCTDDSAAHIAEETANATKVGPIAIISAVSGTATLGWVLSIVTSFVTPCATELLDSPLPLPMGQVYYNVLGKHGMLGKCVNPA